MQAIWKRPSRDIPKSEALVRVTVVYVIALFIAGGILVWSSAEPLWRALWADLAATVVVFGASRWHRNSSFYDAFWSVIPPVLMLWWMVVGSSESTLRELLVLALLLYWATRLTCHWAYYWPGLHHEDWRYGMLREQAGRNAIAVDFMGVHVFPTIQVFLGMLPVYAVTVVGNQPLNALDILASIVMFSAITLQMTADVQLHAFAAQAKPGDVLDTGLWSRCRHPNYLGEIGMWVGLALFGLAAYPQGVWWVGLGALAMILMFRYASIPMMEKRSLERRPEYAETMARIPMLLPRLRANGDAPKD